MIEANELSGGVWLFRGDESGRNFCVVLGERGALLVDPGLPSAIERFLGDMGAEAIAVARTRHDPGEGVGGPWAGLPLLLPGMFEEPTPLESMPGWQAVPFTAAGTAARPHLPMSLFQSRERVLLCGDFLPEPVAGVPRLDGGSEAYLESLQLIEALNPKLIVPWRGDPASGKRAIKARIENDRNYVNSLFRHVATASGSGVPLDRLMEVARTLYDDFPHLEAHLENMQAVWRDLREE